MALDRPEWGLTDWDEEWLFFVHGTILEPFDSTQGILDVGSGDFGAGFYTYLASGRFSGWGIEMALEWASRKSDDKNQTPCLVYARMPSDIFAAMTIFSCDRHNCQSVYARHDPYARTGYELVVGPVGRRQSGRKVPDEGKPFQFKFEGLGLTKLIIDRVESQ